MKLRIAAMATAAQVDRARRAAAPSDPWQEIQQISQQALNFE